MEKVVSNLYKPLFFIFFNRFLDGQTVLLPSTSTLLNTCLLTSAIHHIQLNVNVSGSTFFQLGLSPCVVQDVPSGQ